jgi:hypothetical protein
MRLTEALNFVLTEKAGRLHGWLRLHCVCFYVGVQHFEKLPGATYIVTLKLKSFF